MSPGQCHAETTEWNGEPVRCIHPAGHDGLHEDGCIGWRDPVVEHNDPAPWPPSVAERLAAGGEQEPPVRNVVIPYDEHESVIAQLRADLTDRAHTERLLRDVITDVRADNVKARAERDTLRAESARLHDLVRHQRGALHDAELVSDEEYAALAADHGAVARLEGYDALRAELAATREREAAMRALLDDVLAAYQGVGDFEGTGEAMVPLVSRIRALLAYRGKA